jgi:hypothetical protein
MDEECWDCGIGTPLRCPICEMPVCETCQESGHEDVIMVPVIDGV